MGACSRVSLQKKEPLPLSGIHRSFGKEVKEVTLALRVNEDSLVVESSPKRRVLPRKLISRRIHLDPVMTQTGIPFYLCLVGCFAG